MFNDDYYSFFEKIESSYNAGNVFTELKKQSAKELFILTSLIILWIVSAVLTFKFILENSRYNWNMLLLFMAVSVASFFYFRNFAQRENLLFQKRNSEEENACDKFIMNLSQQGIGEEYYELIISHYERKLKHYSKDNPSSFILYFNSFFIPVLISYLFTRKENLDFLIFAIIGLFFMPGIIEVIRTIFNTKINMYNGIKQYLEYYLETKKFKNTTSKKEVVL